MFRLWAVAARPVPRGASVHRRRAESRPWTVAPQCTNLPDPALTLVRKAGLAARPYLGTGRLACVSRRIGQT